MLTPLEQELAALRADAERLRAARADLTAAEARLAAVRAIRTGLPPTGLRRLGHQLGDYAHRLRLWSLLRED